MLESVYESSKFMPLERYQHCTANRLLQRCWPPFLMQRLPANCGASLWQSLTCSKPSQIHYWANTMLEQRRPRNHKRLGIAFLKPIMFGLKEMAEFLKVIRATYIPLTKMYFFSASFFMQPGYDADAYSYTTGDLHNLSLCLAQCKHL